MSEKNDTTRMDAEYAVDHDRMRKVQDDRLEKRLNRFGARAEGFIDDMLDGASQEIRTKELRLMVEFKGRVSFNDQGGLRSTVDEGIEEDVAREAARRLEQKEEPSGLLTGSGMSECQCYEGSIGCLGPPCVMTRPDPNRVTVRWSEDLIRHLSTKGREMAPGETIRVTKGLPEDARLVAVELNQSGWPETIAFIYETEETSPTGEVRVEHSVEHAHGTVPVEAIRLAMGAVGAVAAEPDELEAATTVDRWLNSLAPKQGEE